MPTEESLLVSLKRTYIAHRVFSRQGGKPKRMASPVLRAAQKMAMSSGVVRRAASRSSSLIALATRYARAPLAPGSSSSFPPLLHQPFSTSSADNPDKSPEFPDSKSPLESSNKVSLADDGVSYPNLGDKIHNEIASYSNLDGLPFDSIKLEGFGTLALRRKTKDEIIEIKVREDYDRTEKCECLWMYVKINYGKEFKKRMKFDIISLPDDPEGRFVIRNVTMSVDDDNLEEVHVDEMEGFLEKRGINNDIIEFIVKYAEERRAYRKYGDYVNN